MFSAPDYAGLPSGTSFSTYRAKSGMIEADYSDENTLTIRKSFTTGGNDLIGDYTNYSKSWNQTVNGLTVSCRGDGDTANAVTFDSAGAHYSISYNMGDEGNGLTADQIDSLISSIQ